MKVKIAKIVDELEMSFSERTVFYNKITGDTLYVDDDDFRRVEEDDYESFICELPVWYKNHLNDVYDLVYINPDNYVALPNSFEVRDSDIMEEFIDTITDNKKRAKLEECMWRKGMYRKFKDMLKFVGLEEEYYNFYDEKLKEIAIDWCKRNGLVYEE